MKLLGYIVFYVIFRPFLWLPFRILYLLSDVLFVFLYYVARYRKNVVLKNLRRSFPGKNEEWYKSTSKKFFRHLSDYFVESLKFESMSEKSLRKRCQFKNIELIEEANKRGQDVIALLGHYNNWEWITSLTFWTTANCATVYKPLKNKYFDRYFLKIRERLGVTLIPMKQSVREILKLRMLAKRSITGLIADQSPNKFEHRYWLKFMNQNTAVFEGADKIARKTGATVVYFEMKKIRRGYYETEIIPMFEDAKNTEEHQITHEYYRLLQKTIENKPEYWLWSHKRWKHKRPKGMQVNEIKQNG